MSGIIVREVGAKKISDKTLNNSLYQTSGWGITWFKNGKAGFQRSLKKDEFLDTFRKKEMDDLKMIIHFNNLWTGTLSVANTLPYYIPNFGILSVSGLTSEIPDDVDMEFPSGDEKSHEVIIGEIFKNYCDSNRELVPIQIWNRFLIQEKELLSHVQLVLMLLDGTILNNNIENGIHEDGNKIWILSDEDELQSEPLRTFDFKEVQAELDDWNIIIQENLLDLTVTELSYLCDNYSEQMSEIIKYGISGFDFQAADEEETFENYILKDDPTSKCCYDCCYHFDINLMFPIIVNNKNKYLCEECYVLNGVTR